MTDPTPNTPDPAASNPTFSSLRPTFPSLPVKFVSLPAMRVRTSGLRVDTHLGGVWSSDNPVEFRAFCAFRGPPYRDGISPRGVFQLRRSAGPLSRWNQAPVYPSCR